MPIRTARAIVLLGLLLGACGDSVTTTPPLGAEPTATTGSSVSPAPSASESPETAPSTESPQTDAEDGITEEENQLIPPIPPNSPTFETTSEGVVVRWRGIGPADLASYLVYHRVDDADSWTLVAEVFPAGENLGDYFHVAPLSDPIGEYALVSLDVDGNRSQIAIAINIDE